MRSTEKEEVKYALDKETLETIKYDIKPHIDRCDSVADFTRFAIRDHAADIYGAAAGGMLANKLVRRLRWVRGLKEEESGALKPSSVIEERFSRSKTVHIQREYDGILNNIQDETGLEHSVTAQYCLFKELYRTADRTEHLDQGAERRAVRIWNELNGSLVEPKIHLHHVLSKRFGPQRSTTLNFIQNDPKQFESWAVKYKDEFYKSDQYEEIIDLFGDSILITVETIIEEYTEIQFQAGDASLTTTGFLDDLLDDPEKRQ